MEEFQLDFPVWALGTGVDSPQGDRVFSIVRITDKMRCSCMPIFTDTDLAERFAKRLAGDKATEFETILIKNAKSLAVIVGSLAQQGCKHVVVDYFFRKGGTSAVYVDVSNIITECNRQGA
jgi:hypothetical protein